jgi:hypothetical protein
LRNPDFFSGNFCALAPATVLVIVVAFLIFEHVAASLGGS